MAVKRKRTDDGAGSLGDPGFASPMPVRSDSPDETWDAPFAVPTFDKARDPLGVLPPGGASAPKASPKRRGS